MTCVAPSKGDIKKTADLDLGRKIWGSGTGQELYPKAKGGVCLFKLWAQMLAHDRDSFYG